jgi:hypothetical protein
MAKSDLPRSRQQVPTTRVTTREIMASEVFRIGVDEVRAGLPPRFDIMDSWFYERGRLWASIAPANLDPNSRLAIKLYEAAALRGFII